MKKICILTMLIALSALCFAQNGYSWTEPKSIENGAGNIPIWQGGNITCSPIVRDNKGNLYFAFCPNNSSDLYIASEDKNGNFTKNTIGLIRSAGELGPEQGRWCARPQVIITKNNKVLVSYIAYCNGWQAVYVLDINIDASWAHSPAVWTGIEKGAFGPSNEDFNYSVVCDSNNTLHAIFDGQDHTSTNLKEWNEKNVPVYNNKFYGSVNNIPSYISISGLNVILHIINNDFSVKDYNNFVLDIHNFSGDGYCIIKHCQSSDNSEILTAVNSGDGSGVEPAANCTYFHNIRLSLYDLANKKPIDNRLFNIKLSESGDPVPFDITAKPTPESDLYKKFSFSYINTLYNNNNIYFSNDYHSNGAPIYLSGEHHDSNYFKPKDFITLSYNRNGKAVILFFSDITKGLMYTIQEDSDIK